MQTSRVVAIGGSAGALGSLQIILRSLPADFSGAVLVVLHQAVYGSSHLIDVLRRASPLPVACARNGVEISSGSVFVASADTHLMAGKNGLIVGRGPRENRFRPAIDPLFRSVAVQYSNRAVGVLLGGYLDDGVTGLAAMQRCGGIIIIQDPAEAEHPDLLRAALSALEPDFCVPDSEIGQLLARLVLDEPIRQPEIPDDLKREAEIAEGVLRGPASMEELGQMVAFSCPECGGQLWRLSDEVVDRYRCYEGHVYTASTLAAAQASQIERSLWVSMRMMEENVRILKRTADGYRQKGPASLATIHIDRVQELEEHIGVLRNLLLNRPKAGPAASPRK